MIQSLHSPLLWRRAHPTSTWSCTVFVSPSLRDDMIKPARLHIYQPLLLCLVLNTISMAATCDFCAAYLNAACWLIFKKEKHFKSHTHTLTHRMSPMLQSLMTFLTRISSLPNSYYYWSDNHCNAMQALIYIIYMCWLVDFTAYLREVFIFGKFLLMTCNT